MIKACSLVFFLWTLNYKASILRRFLPCTKLHFWGNAWGGMFTLLNGETLFAPCRSGHSDAQERLFSLSRIAARCSSVYSCFLRYGFLPNLNGYIGQSVQVHSLTSLALSQQQSRHLARMAFTGLVIILSFMAITTPVLFFYWSRSISLLQSFNALRDQLLKLLIIRPEYIKKIVIHTRHCG